MRVSFDYSLSVALRYRLSMFVDFLGSTNFVEDYQQRRRYPSRNRRYNIVDCNLSLEVTKKEKEIKIPKIVSAQTFTPFEGLPDELCVQELNKVI